jgi:hypothetical protein
MAQSQASLSISIGADTSKLRADLAVAKTLYRDSLRDLNTAAKEFQQTQDRTRLDEAARRNTAYSKTVSELTSRIKEASAAHNSASVSLTEHIHKLGEFGREAGFAIDGLKALRLGLGAFAGAEVLRGLTDAVKKLEDLDQQAKQTGTTIGTIEALRKQFVLLGGTVQQADAATKSLYATWLEGRAKLRAAGQGVGDETSVLRGRGVGGAPALGGAGAGQGFVQVEQGGQRLINVLHGVQLEALNADEAVKNRLGVDLARFPETTKGFADYYVSVARGLTGMTNTVDRNIITLKVFQQTWAEIGKQLQAVAATGSLDALKQKMDVTEPTAAQMKALQDYKDAVLELNKAWDEMARTIVGTVAPAVTWFFKTFNDGLKNIGALINLVSSALGALGRGATALFDKANEIALGDKSSASAPIPPAGNAAGGYIRGPGSGTSDSILARLSNGEFVLSAASVRRVGVGYLNNLNGMASGGLVARGFAAGGLATASAGRAVNLHIGGHAFPLSGAGNVVDQLVSHAHWQQMTSAGVAPSWKGARPSGR